MGAGLGAGGREHERYPKGSAVLDEPSAAPPRYPQASDHH